MKNYMDAVRAAGIGRTPQLCQDALIETLEELFAGKKYNGQQSRKELKIFKQDLPVPEDYDADVDTDAAAAPYIVVRMTGGEIKNDDGPQAVEFSLIVCAYDEGKEREGYQDVANIKEDIVQRLCTKPYFGGAFTVLKPIAWAMQQDDTYPYYFGACSLTCTAPAAETATTEWENTSVTQVYCGPTVRGVAKQYTVFRGGIPEALEAFIAIHPEAGVLVVDVERFAETRKRLETAGTAEAILYGKIKSEL